jgi:hypothetical protein
MHFTNEGGKYEGIAQEILVYSLTSYGKSLKLKTSGEPSVLFVSS